MLTTTQSRIKPPVWATVDPAHPLARGLAACWLLNEAAGKVVRDATGRGQDGNLSGDPAWSPGSSGVAVAFDGDDDWIDMGNCLNLGADDVSVLAVLKYSAANQPDGWSGTRLGAVLGKGYLDAFGKGYGLLVETDNRLYWQIRDQGSLFAATSDTPLNDDRWHLVVGVCDRDDAAGLRLYIDGVRQSAAVDATALNGIDLSGSRAFAIGSRQEEISGTWLWDFAGSVAMACVWKRVLSDAEIRRLRQNPFEMLSPRRPATRLLSSANGVPCGGAIQAAASTTASLRVVRSLTGAIHASSSARGRLYNPGVVSLSGACRGSSNLRGSLSVVAARPAFRGLLKTEPAWQGEALFRGRTRAAFELGTAMTRGWFWIRRSGWTAVYHGSGVHDVDWSRVLCMVGPGAREVPLPPRLPHAFGSAECYVVRRFDARGRQEKTVSAAVIVRIAADGRLAPARPNAVTGLAAARIDAGRVRVTWFYCPLDQETAPGRFNVSRADATGDEIGTVLYRGPGFYRFDVTDPADGPGAFVVRATTVAGVESNPVVVPVNSLEIAPPAQAVILAAGPL